MMNKTVLCIANLLLSGLVLMVSLVAAQEPQLQPLEMKTVIVTDTAPGTNYQTGDVDLQEHTGFVTVIKREDFEGKTEDLAQVLKEEAGIQVRQSGGLGSFATVSLRGASSDQVLVFLDGVLLNNASGGGVDLSNIALSDVESIEIYRGITPVNFGKSSIGGVVNIRTLRSKKGTSASVSAGYGSFKTRKVSAFFNHKPGKWDGLLSVGYLASDNDFKFLNDNGTEWNPDDDKWEKRNNAQFDQYNLLARLGYDLSKDVRIELVNQWFSKDQGLPSWNNSPQTETSLDTMRNITTFSLVMNDLGPLHVNTRTSFDYSHKNELYDDSAGQIGLGQQKSRYITDRWGGNIYAEWLTDQNSLSFMIDMHREEYDSKDLLGHQNPTNATRDTISLGLQDSLFLYDDRLTLTPAIRYTIFDNVLNSGTSVWGSSLEPDSNTEDYWSPQLGVKFTPIDSLNLRLNIAQYVREPSFYELFGDRGFIVGNPDLKAEQGVNFDFGFDFSWKPSKGKINQVSVGAALFYNTVDDLITFVYDSRGVGKAVNISKARIRGFEGRINVDFFKYFRFIGNLTWQDPENASGDSFYQGKQLPGRFTTAYNGRFEFNYAGIKVYGEYVRESGMFYDAANLLEAEDKKEINSGISWHYGSMLFSLEGKNLTDNHFEDFNGYPMPGRAIYATVTYRY